MLIPLLILIPLIGACFAMFQHRSALIASASALIVSAYIFAKAAGGDSVVFALDMCGFRLTFVADGFRGMYALIACFMWTVCSLMSGQYFGHYKNKPRYFFFFSLTLLGVLGVFLSDDLYTTFIFFEIMSISSYPWVAHDETPDALRAAQTYLGVAIFGGMVTLMGMFMLYARLGSLAFADIREARGATVPAALILVGFLAKAGAFPLHIWLPKAHPVAPAPASALLSGMLTKTGLFGVLVISVNIFAGSYIYGCVLLVIALVTMFAGAALALFSVNLKRTLACSSMSQIGYILTGVAAASILGDEGALALTGGVLHMVNHSILKLTLFLCAGSVYMNLHKLDLNDIRGYGRNKPLLNAVFLLGALGLMGVPLFNGYVSKTMIHEGLVEAFNMNPNVFAFKIAEWVFLFAAGLTTGYMLKLYIAIFIQKPKTDFPSRGYLKNSSRVALILACFAIPVIGVLPNLFAGGVSALSGGFLRIGELERISFFNFENLRGGLITLVIGALAYVFVVRRFMLSPDGEYIDRLPARFDLENSFYRPVFCKLLPDAAGRVCAVLDKTADFCASAFVKALGGASGVLDNIADRFARAFAAVLTFICRVFDEFTDDAVLLLRELAFINHSSDSRPAPVTGYARRIRALAGSASKNLARLKPRARLDSREVTDLRYGTQFTNSVTFGLMLSTLGIVIALAYALLPAIF